MRSLGMSIEIDPVAYKARILSDMSKVPVGIFYERILNDTGEVICCVIQDQQLVVRKTIEEVFTYCIERGAIWVDINESPNLN